MSMFGLFRAVQECEAKGGRNVLQEIMGTSDFAMKLVFTFNRRIRKTACTAVYGGLTPFLEASG
jgi:hypothetical protein